MQLKRVVEALTCIAIDRRYPLLLGKLHNKIDSYTIQSEVGLWRWFRTLTKPWRSGQTREQDRLLFTSAARVVGKEEEVVTGPNLCPNHGGQNQELTAVCEENEKGKNQKCYCCHFTETRRGEQNKVRFRKSKFWTPNVVHSCCYGFQNRTGAPGLCSVCCFGPCGSWRRENNRWLDRCLFGLSPKQKRKRQISRLLLFVRVLREKEAEVRV